MIGAVIVLGVVAVALLGLVVWLIGDQRRERAEWASATRVLVDRAIAKDVGEVIAMDRSRRGKPEREREDPKLVEGLS